MRKATVLFRGREAGELTQQDDGAFRFSYFDAWFADPSKSSIALTLPKSQQSYESPHLFPFFFHLLPEGINRQVACKLLRIDTSDDFGLLLALGSNDTIGAVTIQAQPMSKE